MDIGIYKKTELLCRKFYRLLTVLQELRESEFTVIYQTTPRGGQAAEPVGLPSAGLEVPSQWLMCVCLYMGVLVYVCMFHTCIFCAHMFIGVYICIKITNNNYNNNNNKIGF